MWKFPFTLEGIQALSRNTMVDHLGIEFTGFGEDFLIARMPVDRRTIQPMGLLHGGASVALAETLGSVASALCLEDPTKQSPAGVEINANHLRSVREGFVYATCKPVRVGRTIHVWQIDIRDESGQLTCTSRLTIAIVDAKK
ncbi:MAG: hotdog fold thioesterase [Saprospiraceae bacterium]